MPSSNLYPLAAATRPRIRATGATGSVTVKAPIHTLLARLLGVAALALTNACAYHAPDGPTPTPPMASTVPVTLNLGSVAGSGTSANATILTATVQNGGGIVLPGVLVSFSTDVGTLSAASMMTTANGQAVSTLTSAGGSTSAVTVTAGTLSTNLVVTTSANVPAPPTPTPPVLLPDPTTPLGPLSLTISSTTPLLGTSTIFEANIRNGSGSLSVVWDFGDGVSGTTTSTTTAHTYGAAGNYTVRATATDTLGRSASTSTSASVTATPAPPPVVIVAPTPSYVVTVAPSSGTVSAGGSATLTATALAVNSAPAPTLYAWDCDNNGSTDFTTPTPSTTCPYPTAGSVVSKVTVTGGSATGSGTTTVTVTAIPTVPVPSYAVLLSPSLPTVRAGSNVTLTAFVTKNDGAPEPTLYTWFCRGDDYGVTTTTGPGPGSNILVCNYLTIGTFTPKVVVSGGAVNVTAMAPTVSVTQ